MAMPAFFAVACRHQMLVVRLGGATIIVVGVLLLTGWWSDSAQRPPGRRPRVLGAGVTQLDRRPSDDRQATPLPADLDARGLARWSWRQLATSTPTALVLLLLLALASIPGSVIPQEDIDSLAVSQWRDNHPRLAPIWDRVDLFAVYGSARFSAIYILLMISLVGCIIPRLFVYARAFGPGRRGHLVTCRGCRRARRTRPTRTPTSCSAGPRT